MRIIITAGGGGHFAPALSVISSMHTEDTVLLVGAKYGLEGDKAKTLEYETAQSLGIPFASLTTGRLQRKFTRHTVFSLLKIPQGLYQAIKIVKAFSPDVVLSFGGYISLPVVVASFLLRIPIVIHEQTLEAGMANKIAAIFATKICISWESSKKFFPEAKTILTGNPIRKYQVSSIPSARAQGEGKYQVSKENLPFIYITGGSLGSHAINVLMEGCIEKLLRAYVVFHQTGDAKQYGDFDRLQKLRESFPKELQARYVLTKFVSPFDVGKILEKADLVVARSGINMVSELIYFGKPSLLIPLPFSQQNEQTKNALFLQSLGLGKVFAQKALTDETLYAGITSMIKDKEKYLKNASSAKKILPQDGAQKIIDVIKSVA